jgi:hypothetical protein
LSQALYAVRQLPLLPSRPGDFHPEPLTDPDLSLSTHPQRVARLEQNIGLGGGQAPNADPDQSSILDTEPAE